jgi:hypothetical protein
MYYVPAEAGHDGSTAGGTNCLSMGSASVPMGTQGKHDLLLRITPASSPTGGRQAPRRVPGSSLGSSHAGSSEPKQEAAARCLKPIPSGQVTMSIGSFGDTCLLYIRSGGLPGQAAPPPTEAWGWLVGHPCRLPAAAGTGGYLQETSSSLAAVACLATTPLLAPLMPPLLLRFTARPYV